MKGFNLQGAPAPSIRNGHVLCERKMTSAGLKGYTLVKFFFEFYQIGFYV